MTTPKRPRDTNQLAKFIADLSVGETTEAKPGKKSAAGRAGGLKGGKTRMAALDAKQRTDLARKAAAKRWKKPAPDSEAG